MNFRKVLDVASLWLAWLGIFLVGASLLLDMTRFFWSF